MGTAAGGGAGLLVAQGTLVTLTQLYTVLQHQLSGVTILGQTVSRKPIKSNPCSLPRRSKLTFQAVFS